MPRGIIYGLLILIALSFIPMALLVRAQSAIKTKPRLQVVPDMDSQPKFKAQSVNNFFQDGRAMRQQPTGTLARGQLDTDDLYYYGLDGEGEFSGDFPVDVTEALLARGRERYVIYCAACHGLSGNGNGPVHLRAEKLQEGTWTPPTDMASAVVQGRPNGHLYNTITNGIRNMPAYGFQIEVADRWAIVAYVRALQRSRAATLADVPAEMRKTLQ
jgi:mono/diheme cytochrome c family protein